MLLCSARQLLRQIFCPSQKLAYLCPPAGTLQILNHPVNPIPDTHLPPHTFLELTSTQLPVHCTPISFLTLPANCKPLKM